MRVMLGNHSSPIFHYWAGKYPDKMGWLVGPSGQTKTRLREWIPYALDNDVYADWDNGREWSEDGYYRFLDWVSVQKFAPLWAAVPDAIGDRGKTLEKWVRHSDRVRAYGWPVAFVVQDGMTPKDVPPCDVIFIGGTFRWKWNNVEKFAHHHPRVHVGRVNTLGKLRRCDELGIESVDGTGWFRRPEIEFARLEEYLCGKPENQIPFTFNQEKVFA